MWPNPQENFLCSVEKFKNKIVPVYIWIWKRKKLDTLKEKCEKLLTKSEMNCIKKVNSLKKEIKC